MTSQERTALADALRMAAAALGRAAELLDGSATVEPSSVDRTPSASVDAEARRRQAAAERARRYRDRKRDAGVMQRDGERDGKRDASVTLRDANPSRACARSSSEEEEKNKNTEQRRDCVTPRDGVMRDGVTVDSVTPASVTATVTTTVARRKPAAVDPADVEEPVRRVWVAYADAVKSKVVLSAARVKLIRDRLAEGWTADELVAAVKGYGISRWHFGENDRGRRFVDLELWIRDAKHVEAGMGMASRAAGVTGVTMSQAASRGANSSSAAMASARSIEAQFEEWERQGCPGLDGKPTKPVTA